MNVTEWVCHCWLVCSFPLSLPPAPILSLRIFLHQSIAQLGFVAVLWVEPLSSEPQAFSPLAEASGSASQHQASLLKGLYLT